MLTNLSLNFIFVLASFIFWQMSHGLGQLILNRLPLSLKRPLDRIIISTALGWITLGYVLYLLGLLHLIYWPILLGIAIVLTMIAFFQKPWTDLGKLHPITWYRSLPRAGQILTLVLIFFAGLNLMGALAPDAEFDSTWYHLPEARLYLEQHHTRLIFPSMLDISSIAPRLPEILFMFLLAPAKYSSTLPQLFEWLAGLSLAAGTYALGRRLLSPEAAVLAALAVYSINIIGWLSQVAYVDLIQASFGLAAALAITAWREERTQLAFGWLIGLLLAGFLGSKMQSLVFYPVFFFLAFILVPDQTANWRTRWRQIRPTLSWILVISGLLAFSWYLEIWIVTGNPFFSLHQPAGSELLGGGQTLTDWIFNIHPKTLASTVSNFFRQSAPLFPVAFLAIFFWKYLPLMGRALLLTGTLSILAWTYFPIHVERYAVVCLPLLAVPLAWLFDRNKQWLWIGTIGVISIAIGSNLSIFKLTALRWPVAIGRQSRAEFLTDRFNENSIWMFYDPQDKVKQLVGDGTALTLVHNPFYVDIRSIDAIAFSHANYQSLTTLDAVILIWKKAGITHLLAHGPSRRLEDFAGLGRIMPPEEQKKLTDRVILRYDNQFTQLWELK